MIEVKLTKTDMCPWPRRVVCHP